ncbi:MAG TPA: hypothetical protein VEG64_03515 [Candidatus Sulfotelmatobacter sp.]|nr:hypothetical protein [Candidatus Sulfotelmatobacter sp.]
MRVEQLDKLSRKELRSKANQCFGMADASGPVDRPGHLAEAEFYMRELAQRRDSWVSIRDLVLEVVVIILIGWEIWLSYRAEGMQKDNFKTEQQVFEHLEESSRATADSLVAVKGTMEGMNTALQRQLALYYDVSVNVVYEQDTKDLLFSNNGRTNVSLWGVMIERGGYLPGNEGRTIPPGGSYKIELPQILDLMNSRFPKPAEGFIAFEVYLKNEKNEEFVLHGYFAMHWKNDVGKVGTQTASIMPERWSKPATKPPPSKKSP